MKDTLTIIEKGTDQGKKSFTRNYGNSRDRSTSNNRSISGSRANTNRDRIRCYTCREYDNFVRNCPNSREEKFRTFATNVKYRRTRS